MKKRKKGQSTIEFALVMTIFIGMLSVTYNTVVAFSVHQYISYAAFMSARAMQAAHVTPALQRDAAIQSLRRFIPLMDSSSLQADTLLSHSGAVLASNINANVLLSAGPESGFWNETSPRGVRISFEVPFVRLPIGPGMREGLESFNMEVASYLGREVSVVECRSYFQAFFSLFGRGGGAHDFRGMEDSGC